MRKIFFGIFLSLFFYLNVQALFIKAEKDNHKAQTGYITTVKESNVQNIAFAEKNSSILYSIFRQGTQYCMSAVKLSLSVASSSIFTNCFDSELSVGIKIIKVLMSPNGSNLYLFSKHKASAYSVSTISNKVKAKIGTETISQNIIDVKESNSRLYVLTYKEESNNGSLIIFSIQRDGSLQKVEQQSLGYKPIAFKLYSEDAGDYIYIRSKEELYKYDIASNSEIFNSVKLLEFPANTIKDFGVKKDSDKKTLRLIVALKKGDSGINNGSLKLYMLNTSSVRLTSTVNLELEPYKILAYNEKDMFLVAYQHSFDIRAIDINKNLIEDELLLQRGVDGAVENVIYKDNLTAIVSDAEAQILDQIVFTEILSLKDKAKQLLFSSNNDFIAVANKNSIDIFEIIKS
ncbi:hypothetical protein LO80_02300 [Candidatus Francisella endociliophora]|uniref:Uncharacterized protein n=1 Tax=Candidatus Francisella endociliophora TaxID=653937 RepID=A0A097EMX6_9GAMM|nr:hypothetical protein [Francisella sp. FSC1006]AIT08924.1 hypothetical protein LO80_02300 [Francisella sp. FSC1006]